MVGLGLRVGLGRSGAIGVASGFDADAAAWFAVVEAAGSVFADGAKNAYNNFFVSEKANGNLTAFNNGMLLAFAGFDGLAGCFVPIRARGGAVPINVGFVAGQKSTTGLQGNNSAYIDCGIGYSAEQLNNHCIGFSGNSGTLDFGGIIGTPNAEGSVLMVRFFSSASLYITSGGNETFQAPSFSKGLAMLNRIDSSSYTYRNNDSLATYSSPISTIPTGNINIFRAGGFQADPFLQLAFWGAALPNAAGWDTAIKTLTNALGVTP